MSHPAEVAGCRIPHPAERLAGSTAAGEQRQNYHSFVFGNKVTGIGLRAQIAQNAANNGVTGWAQNLSDHTVELVGNGNTSSINRLSSFLQSQKKVSRITEQFQNTENKGAYHHFYTIGHQGHATNTGKAWPFQADYVGDINKHAKRSV